MPKDHLLFESKTPSFLRRLRGEAPLDSTGQERDPDRHAIPQVRAKRPRTEGEDDDGPVVVDESGREVDGEELKDALTEGDGTGGAGDVSRDGRLGEGGVEVDDKGPSGKEIVAGFGGKRRRDGPKVVGGGENGQGEEKSSTGKKAATTKTPKPDSEESAMREKSVASKTKKKSKKIKLSFENDDG